MTTETKKGIQYVCEECQEPQSWMGSIWWSVEKQEWELQYPFDFGYLPLTCDSCGAEYDDLEVIDVDIPPKVKKIPTCMNCCSENVSLRATQIWDEEKQDWATEEPFNWVSYCDDCGLEGEGIGMKEVPCE